MKYQVATIVSIVLCALLIGGAEIQAHQREQRDAAITAELSKLDMRQLAMRYWACQPLLPGKTFEGDAHACRIIDAAMERRNAEAPALEVVKIIPPTLIVPENFNRMTKITDDSSTARVIPPGGA